MAWLLPRSWPGTHLFTGLWLQPPVAQGFDLTKSQSSGGRDQTIKAAMLQGALDSLQLPCSSSSACGEGQSPTGVTSDPLTLHIKASSCLPGTASLVWWLKPLQQRILGRALVPWGDREGTLGSQNSQETKYWEQQQQQERQGAGSMLSTPPRCTTFSRAPNRMG